MPQGTIPSLNRFVQAVFPAILGAVDPGRAVDMAAGIVENDRWNSFDRWHETSRRLLSAYEASGAKAELYAIPTGGARGRGNWIIPEAADIIDAAVDLIEPSPRRLLDYRTCPWHVVQWSAATPADGITCELVVIDAIAQLDAAADGSLAGKIVLTRLNPWLHRGRFCAGGAAGLLCDMPVDGCPDAVAWTKFGWGGLDLWEAAPPLVGFAISAGEGDRLRALAAQGAKLVVHAKLDIRRYAGSHDVISGVIRGSDDPDAEIWAVAHSCEPGALDNASGGACCVEIARVLNGLIAKGQIAPPRRTIRLLHGYECYGFFHYLEHGFRLAPPLAGVCIDTVGARPDVCDGALSWHATAPASASFVDDVGLALLEAALEMQPIYRLAQKPFLSTEDTLLGDPKYGFPCPWITNHPCRGYHSSADTIEMIDPQGMAVCTAAMAGYLYYLANASTDEAMEMAGWQTQRAATKLQSEKEPLSRPQRESIRCQHEATIDRLSRFTLTGDHAKITGDLGAMVDTIANAAAVEPFAPAESSPHEDRAGRLIPLRRRSLGPTPENVWPDVKAGLDGWFPKWAAYWADGQRSIAEIATLLALNAEEAIAPWQVTGYFHAIAALGCVELLERDEFLSADALTTAFAELGIRPGMDVMIHSSLKSIGPVRGGAATIISALLSVVGNDGTLLAPTFNHHHALAFNPLTTPTTDGAIPEAMWRRPDARRSLHPSHSVAAIGPRADDYLRDHLTHGVWADQSPIGRLILNDGYILSIGVGHDRTTAYHIAEIAMNVPCLDMFANIDRIAGSDGRLKTVRGLAWRNGECPVDPAGLDAMLEQKQSHGKVGRASATLARAADVFNARREQLGDRCSRCGIRPQRRNVGEEPHG
ncbi:MAG TPA: AAC(3) family N-acetyltransferase [Tepidisphaeraceae bacterium]|jgi:aminoglycoside 3-N-acetyltransferase|nr:AAC(3) family N-acetyltransferase [Tepidisphaeraceae bacterium]